MQEAFSQHLDGIVNTIRGDGLLKQERLIASPQSSRIRVIDHTEVQRDMINLCANNYLGLADHPDLIAAAKHAMDENGYGMASVRFICGTQSQHCELENAIAGFLGKEAAILFASCFDANGGLFEPLLDANDAIISDSLNHASIIDGIRLCKAQRYRYENSDMADLEARLEEARANCARFILIATDGVFSMDGYLAKLPEITTLARKYGALVMVDDCHATGFIGPTGAGTPEHFGVDVDILTGTLGKALGGAVGGYIAGPRQVIDLLRQRARPYLFSNSLPPSVVAAGLKAIELVQTSDALRQELAENTKYWRAGLENLGFNTLPGSHPIVPIMLGDAALAQRFSSKLYELGVYAVAFSFPVVPRGQARIRTQMNAALNKQDLDDALDAFSAVGRELEII